jgi:SpoVK/Ycf46/Vps4 family AAA+-type ATPase
VEVVLGDSAAASIAEFLHFMAHVDKLTADGIGVSPSLLLSGPPGCGKTETARYVASQLGLSLVTARVDSLVSSYLGSTSKNLRMLFDHAASRPCVLFLDEFDSVAKLRDDRNELGELKRVVVALLQNLDILAQSHTVLVAATNHPHLLDPAIWRRFAFHVKIDLPDERVRTALLGMFFGEFLRTDDLPVLAAATDAMSGAALRQVADDSKRAAVVSGVRRVDLAEAMRRILRYRFTDTELSGDAWIGRLRDVAPNVFTYRVLSEISGRSIGHLSKLLKGGFDGSERTASDQGRPPGGRRPKDKARGREQGKAVRRR